MVGALISAGLGLASSAIGGRQAEHRQHEAQDFSAQQFATRYQTETADMKKAGLNPMLAYQKGGGNAPSSSAAGQTNPDLGASQVVPALLASANEAQIRKDTELKEQQRITEVQESWNRHLKGLTELELPGKVKAEVQSLNQGVVESGKRISQMDATINNMQIEADKMREQIKNLEQERKTGKAQEDVNRSIIVRNNQLNALTRAEEQVQQMRTLAYGQQINLLKNEEKAAMSTLGKISAYGGHVGKTARAVGDVISVGTKLPLGGASKKTGADWYKGHPLNE